MRVVCLMVLLGVACAQTREAARAPEPAAAEAGTADAPSSERSAEPTEHALSETTCDALRGGISDTAQDCKRWQTAEEACRSRSPAPQDPESTCAPEIGQHRSCLHTMTELRKDYRTYCEGRYPPRP